MRHDLTSLRLFVAVAECGSLTRAAERQHLAVSAISKRIAELEAQAGTALLVRYPRGVGLTPAGQSVLQHARQLLQVMQHLDEELGEYAGGAKGHVRLHAIASVLTQFLPEEVESFLTRYPGVNVSLEERTGKAIVRAVAEGAADVGIVAGGTGLQGLVGMAYRVDRLMLGVPPGHPLSRRRAVRFAEALDHPFVGPHADSSLSELMAQGARACGKPLRQRIQVSSFDAMCRLVETRLGISLLPAGVLMRHAAAGRLRLVALKEDWAERELRIVVRSATSPAR
jgi:DNA-binding transcriptional LysR family regulator